MRTSDVRPASRETGACGTPEGDCESAPSGECWLEVHRDVEAREPRLDDGGRPQPLAAGPEAGCGREVVGAVVPGRRVHVEDVVEVDADVGAAAAEAEQLGEPHV